MKAVGKRGMRRGHEGGGEKNEESGEWKGLFIGTLREGFGVPTKRKRVFCAKEYCWQREETPT